MEWLPHKDPVAHWQRELDSAEWRIHSGVKLLQANELELKRMIESKEARIEESRLRNEGFGYRPVEALNHARDIVTEEIHFQRSMVEMEEESLHKSCMDYRVNARKLANEEPGPPSSPPAVCNSL